MATGFQPDAFQSDAFQQEGGLTGTPPGSDAFQGFQQNAFQGVGGVVGSSGVVGTLATTNANDTLAASGTTVIQGFLARTNANDTLIAIGTSGIGGTVSVTNADDSLAATGSAGSSFQWWLPGGDLGFFNDDEWKKVRERRPQLKAEIRGAYEKITGEKPLKALPMPVIISEIERNVSRGTIPQIDYQEIEEKIRTWILIERQQREIDDEEALVSLLH